MTVKAHSLLGYQATTHLRTIPAYKWVIGIASYCTGLLYLAYLYGDLYTEYSIPKTIHALYGVGGYATICIYLMMGGAGAIVSKKYFNLITPPLVAFNIAVVFMAVNGGGLTALAIYPALFVFPLYLHYRETMVRLNARLIMIPLKFAIILCIFALPDDGALNLLYGVFNVWFNGAIDSRLFYLLIHAISITGLILAELNKSPMRGRVATQFFIIPILVHTLLFAYLSLFRFQAYPLAPFLIASAMLWWLLASEYDYAT